MWEPNKENSEVLCREGATTVQPLGKMQAEESPEGEKGSSGGV